MTRPGCHQTEFRPSRCLECNLGFISAYSARVHRETVHGTKEASTIKTETIMSALECEDCGRTFSSRQSLATHTKAYHRNVSRAERRSRKAQASKRSQESKERRQQQAALDDPGTVMENSTNPMIFRCMSCSLNPTDKLSVFTRHINFYHTKEGQVQAPKLQCTQCEKEFGVIGDLQKHITTEHPTTYKPVRCAYCNLGFQTKVSCHLHKLNAHPHEMESALNPAKKKLTDDVAHFFREEYGEDLKCDPDTGKWNCIFTDCAFANLLPSRVKKHVRSVHMKVGNWKCEHCEKEGKKSQKFTCQTNLNRHISGVHLGVVVRNSSNDFYVCDICGKSIYGRSKMDQHKSRVHSDHRPFVCTKCGRSWVTQHDLKRHEERSRGSCHLPKSQRSKSKRGSLKCPNCPFSASSQEGLATHLEARNTDTGKCPKIKNRHRRDGDDQFRCEHCNQSYHYKDSLKRHVALVHHKEPGSACSICGKVYRQHLLMIRHQATAHGQTKLLPHRCSFCPKQFLIEKNLKIHCKDKHSCTTDGTPL